MNEPRTRRLTPRHHAVVAALGMLCATAGPLAGAALAARLPRVPFAHDAIWNRKVPLDATFTDVQDALFGATAAAPRSLGVDLVTLCETDASAPLTSIERSSGWTYPQRAQSSGEVLYQRHLAPDACLDVTWNRIGNALFVLHDPTTGLADLGIGGWREPGGPLLNTASNGSSAHGLDVRRSHGIRGYGRGSSLPALGGLLREHELSRGIRHAVAVVMPITRLSATRHFVWPASSADGLADLTYQGPNPDFAMGTLLAIPRTVRLRDHAWRTKQGRRLATAAQLYGWYVVDSVLAPQVQLAIATEAARTDLGLAIDGETGRMSVDPAKVDADGLTADVLQILTLVRAVVSNAP